MSNRFAVFSIIATIAMGFAGQAFAHAHLKTSVPSDKSTVTASPASLALSFSEGLNLKFTGIKLIGPQKATVKTGDAALTDNGTGLAVPVTGTLPAGTYTVEWHALSTDGHKTTGTYSFTVKP